MYKMGIQYYFGIGEANAEIRYNRYMNGRGYEKINAQKVPYIRKCEAFIPEALNLRFSDTFSIVMPWGCQPLNSCIDYW